MEITMTKVSTKKEKKNGVILHMFTFAYGKGSARKSFTKHCTDKEAKMTKEALNEKI